jgi:ABC-type amino acid transport substrate-binding protein
VALVAAGPPPAGAKSGGLVTWGALAVSLASAGSFQVVVDMVASWLRRQPADIEIEIDGQKLSGTVTREQREALVQAFLARTAGGAAETGER